MSIIAKDGSTKYVLSNPLFQAVETGGYMYTVVVADDEEELRRALVRRVDWESVGFRVVGEAENGVEALELVERLEPDLLLTDVKMPFISGIELARQIREVRPTMQIAFLSGYDDFAYAQQAIQYNIISYLLKPISSAELTEELAIIKLKIDKKFKEFMSNGSAHEWTETTEFIMPLMLDGFLGSCSREREQKLLEEGIACGLIKSGGDICYTAMVTVIRNEKGEKVTLRANVNAIDSILRKYIKHVSFYANGRIVSLLVATKAGFDKYLHILVEDIAQSVKRIMKLNCTIGISRPVEKLSGCHEAYVEAVNAAGYTGEAAESEIRFISDVEPVEDVGQDTLAGVILDIESLIRSGTQDTLETYLTELFDKYEKERVSLAGANFRMVQLISAVYRVASSVEDDNTIFKLQQNSPMVVGDGLHKFREKYTSFCLIAREMLAEARKQSSTLICERALELIEREYMMQEISLVSISSEIAVSPNYLSSLIRKSTGSTFVDLLTQKRMEKAKELLLGTSMKIKEISEKCGYNDQHYFSYCFKKYTGVSPNTSRRQNEGFEAQK